MRKISEQTKKKFAKMLSLISDAIEIERDILREIDELDDDVFDVMDMIKVGELTTLDAVLEELEK